MPGLAPATTVEICGAVNDSNVRGTSTGLILGRQKMNGRIGAALPLLLLAVIACTQNGVGAEVPSTSDPGSRPATATVTASVPAPAATVTPLPVPTATATIGPPTPPPIAPLPRLEQFAPLDRPVFVSAAAAPSRITDESFMLGLEWNGEARLPTGLDVVAPYGERH
jgi:hypothetical protein